MRVVIAAGSYGSECGPPQAARELAAGWTRQAPHDQVRAVPVSDGGAGFLDAMAELTDTAPTPVVVGGPDGTAVPAGLLFTDEADGRTAYVQAGFAAGRDLIDAATAADPTELTSAGVGELLEVALDAGARRIVLGCGDLASHDGGKGMLVALGAGSGMQRLASTSDRFAGIDLVLAAASDLPLLGFHGASAALGTDHGVAAGITQRLENRMGELTEQVAAALPPRRDLLTGRPIRVERAAASGVGGGVGYAALVLGARVVAGARWVLERSGVLPELRGALVVTGTEVYDWRGVREGVVAETARAAAEVAAPTVVVATEVQVGRREGMSLGIAGSYASTAGEGLADLAARVARTWSPPPDRA